MGIEEMTALEKEHYEERAAIAQFCGLLSKEEAEKLAMEELKNIRRKVDQDKVQK